MSHPPQPPVPDDEPRFGARLPEGQVPPQQPPAGPPQDEPRYGVRLPEGERGPVPPATPAGWPAGAQHNPYGDQQPNPYGTPVPNPYGGQQPFGGPSPYAVNPTERNSLAVWSLVLGILGFCCGPTSIVGLILGVQARKAAAQGRANNGGLAQAGFVVSIVALVAWLVYLVWSQATGFNPFEGLDSP